MGNVASTTAHTERSSTSNNNNVKTGIAVASCCVVAVGGAYGVTMIRFLRRISNSVGLAPPTESMLRDENPTVACPLFRHLPQLAQTLAWRSLGVKGPTPVHTCQVPLLSSMLGEDDGNNNKKQMVEFWVKREDLISSDYGGNKVRTLQHQLAICEARREAGEIAFRQLVSVGSGGSNQTVATVVHARKLGWDNDDHNSSRNNINGTAAAAAAAAINVAWLKDDEPDLDNTLNMLSVLSFPNVGFTLDWGMKSRLLEKWRAFRMAWTQKEIVPMMMGGNCPSGVLGQAGGILELAEQIQEGTSPDPDRLYIPMGSGCTISGLILGVCLARFLGLKAFVSPNFKIVGCNVHHAAAFMDRLMNMHTNPLFQPIPMTITHSVVMACWALTEVGGPDLEKDAMAFVQTNVELRSNKAVVGKYGGHSELSREAAKHYDEKGTVTDYITGQKEKELWVCGHFVAKALQPLLQDMKADIMATQNDKEEKAPLKFMLWMTKSAVQPRGNVDEWAKFRKVNGVVKEWADNGKAESLLRAGRVSTVDGKPEDYRSIMTKIL